MGVKHNPNLWNSWANRIQIVSAPLTVIYQYNHTHECVDVFFLLPSLSLRQTRSLLSVFEEDAGMLTNYTNQLLQSLQRVFGAQVLSTHTQTDICKLLFPLQSVNGPQTFKHKEIKKWWTCSCWVHVFGCVFAPKVRSVSHTIFEIHWHWTLRSGCCALWLSILLVKHSVVRK